MLNGYVQPHVTVPANVVDTKTIVREGYRWGITEIGQFTAENLVIALKQLRADLSIYLAKLTRDYNAFLVENRLKRQVSALPKKTDDQTVAQKIANISHTKFNKKRNATLRFINTLEEGYALLHYIRQQVTGQTISTKFTVWNNGRMYVVDNSLIHDLYQPVLSTFGGTSGSPFSLAYQLNMERFQAAIAEQREGILDITEDALYQQIMLIKKPYLARLSALRGRKYRPVFNSKDAEIFVSSLNESQSVHAGLVHSYSTSKTLLPKDQNDKSSIFIEKEISRGGT